MFLEYMNTLDIDELLSDLTKQIPISEDSLFLLRVTHRLIKEGIAQGLTLFDLACLIARTNEEIPSPLEIAIGASEDNSQRAIEMRAGRRNVTGSPSFWKNVHDNSFPYNKFNNQHTNSSEKNSAVVYDKVKFASTSQHNFNKTIQALNLHSHHGLHTDEINNTSPRSLMQENENFTISHSPLRKSCASESNLAHAELVREVEPKPLFTHHEENVLYSLEHLSILKEEEEYLQSHTSMISLESSNSPLSPSSNSYFQSDLLLEEVQQETPQIAVAENCNHTDDCGLFLRLHDTSNRYPRPGDALVTLHSYDAKLVRSKQSRTPPKFNVACTTKIKPADAFKDYSKSFNSTITRSTTTTEVPDSDDFTSSAASSLESIGAVRNDSFFLVSNNNNNNNHINNNNNKMNSSNHFLASSPVAMTQFEDHNYITHESDNGTDTELDIHRDLNPFATTTVTEAEEEYQVHIPPASSLHAFSSLSRVVSFGAFESPPLYNLAKSERQVARLKQEKRKLIAKTTEFQLLRLNFTNESITSMINKETRKRIK